MIDQDTQAEAMVKLALCILLIFINLCGNTLVILAYILSNDCRTPVFLLIFNTAIWDMFTLFPLDEVSLGLIVVCYR